MVIIPIFFNVQMIQMPFLDLANKLSILQLNAKNQKMIIRLKNKLNQNIQGHLFLQYTYTLKHFSPTGKDYFESWGFLPAKRASVIMHVNIISAVYIACTIG